MNPSREIAVALAFAVVATSVVPAVAQSPAPSAELSGAPSPGASAPPGAVVTSADGNLSITLPPDVDPSTITIEAIDPDEPPEGVDAELLAGTGYELGPDGRTFDSPVTVRQRFPPIDPAGPIPILVYASRAASGEWEFLSDQHIDPNEDALVVSGTTTHFSRYYPTQPLPEGLEIRTGGAGQVVQVYEALVGQRFVVPIWASDARAVDMVGTDERIVPVQGRPGEGFAGRIIELVTTTTSGNGDPGNIGAYEFYCDRLGEQEFVLYVNVVIPDSAGTFEAFLKSTVPSTVRLTLRVRCLEVKFTSLDEITDPCTIARLREATARALGLDPTLMELLSQSEFNGAVRWCDLVILPQQGGIVRLAAAQEPETVAQVLLNNLGVTKKQFDQTKPAPGCKKKKLKGIGKSAWLHDCKGFMSIQAYFADGMLATSVADRGMTAAEVNAAVRALMDGVVGAIGHD